MRDLKHIYSLPDILNIKTTEYPEKLLAAYERLNEGIKELKIKEISLFDVPEHKTIDLISLHGMVEVHGQDTLGHIETIEPDFIAIQAVYPNSYPFSSIYYLLREYLHNILTHNHIEDLTKEESANLVEQIQTTISKFDDLYLSTSPLAYRVFLFKNSFIFEAKIGYVDLFQETQLPTYGFFEDPDEASEHKIYQDSNELFEKHFEDIAHEYSGFEQIALATNNNLRLETAIFLFNEYDLSKRYPLKIDDVSEKLLINAIKKAQFIYENQTLPNKVKGLIKEGLSLKEISEAAGLTQSKTRRIIGIINSKE